MSGSSDLLSAAGRAFRSALVVACFLSLFFAVEAIHEGQMLTSDRHQALIAIGAAGNSFTEPAVEQKRGEHPLYIVPPRSHKFRSDMAPTRNPEVWPKAVHKVAPEYTEVARKARVSGIVIVEAVIDAQGNVRSVQVLRPLPFGLDEKAADAVAQWRFRPGTVNGAPVPVIMNVAVPFNQNAK